MKPRKSILVITPYIANTASREIRFHKSSIFNDDTDPRFGDFLVDTTELTLEKCRFRLCRFNYKDKDDQSVKDTIRSKQGVILVRMGESLIISNLTGNKHLQLVYLNHKNPMSSMSKFFFFRNDRIDRDVLDNARKFAQRQDMIQKKPQVPQVEPGCRGGYPDVKPSLWRRIISSITGGDKSMFSEKG